MMNSQSLNETFGIEGNLFSLEMEEGDFELISSGIAWNAGTVGQHLQENQGEKETKYKGITFPSRTAAAEHFGVSIAAVTHYVNRKGCRRYETPCFYKGQTYSSLREAAEQTGAKYGSVSTWVQRHKDLQPENHGV